MESIRRRFGKLGLAGGGGVLVAIGYNVLNWVNPFTKYEFINVATAKLLFWVSLGMGVVGILCILVAYFKGTGKPSLKVTVQDVRTGPLLYDNGQDIVQFFVHLTLEASREIQLGALDLVVEGKTYKKVCKPVELPTALVKGIESYEVEYRLPDANRLLIQHGIQKKQCLTRPIFMYWPDV